MALRKQGAIDPLRITTREIARRVRGGSLRAEEVVAAFLDRIALCEPETRAFAWLDPERALAEARALDAAWAAGAAKGPLAGAPLGVKDVVDSADMPTEYGSRLYAGRRPARDASCLFLARRAGAIALGKTVTTEFATRSPIPTVNPRNRAHTPGGSSSGSAAALAAAMALLAFGTQTAGSTIRPSSFCGVVGYVSSRGWIDRTGVKPLAESLDVVGLMARDVRDVALFASVVARRPTLAIEEAEEDAKGSIGVFAPGDGRTPEAAARMAALDRAAAALGCGGKVAQPPWWSGLGPAHRDLFAWEAAAALAPERETGGDAVSAPTRSMMAEQAQVRVEDRRAAAAARDAALGDLDRLFGAHAALLTFAAPGEAPLAGDTGSAAFNIRWTLLGTPSVALPVGLGPNGLPVGVQLVGRPGDDARLLRLAARLEAALAVAGAPNQRTIS